MVRCPLDGGTIDSMLAVYQGEDFESYSLMDSAWVGLTRFPRDEKVPDGQRLYELMCGS